MMFDDIIHHQNVYICKIDACKNSLRTNFRSCTCMFNTAFKQATAFSDADIAFKKAAILSELFHPDDYSNFVEALHHLFRNQNNIYKTEIRVLQSSKATYQRMFLSVIIQSVPHTKKYEFILLLIPVTNEYHHDTTSQKLSNKEKIVQALVEKGLQSKQIAEILHVSVETVKTHRRNIKRKL